MKFKKEIAIALFVVSLGLNAQPRHSSYLFVCPSVQGHMNTLSHYGQYIGGDGLEFVEGLDYVTPAFFKSNINDGQNIPHDLVAAGYTNSDTNYIPGTAMVSCLYTSAVGYDAFRVNYFMVNGTGGQIISKQVNTISVVIPQGMA